MTLFWKQCKNTQKSNRTGCINPTMHCQQPTASKCGAVFLFFRANLKGIQQAEIAKTANRNQLMIICDANFG